MHFSMFLLTHGQSEWRVKIENTKTKLKDSYYSSSRLHSFNHHKTCNLRITHHLTTHSFSSFFRFSFFLSFYSIPRVHVCLAHPPSFQLKIVWIQNSIKLKLTCWCILCKNDFTQTGDDLPWSNIDFFISKQKPTILILKLCINWKY